jgi:signal transduction histidine kinase
LAIVKAAVEDQGGHVSLESIPGQGAKFIFTIPKSLSPAKPLY